METIENILIILFFVVSILMVIVVLLQSSKGSGLSGMLGGGASTQNPFGTSAVDVMAKITRWLAIIFFAICLGFSALYYNKPTSVEDIETSAETEKPLGESAEDNESKEDSTGSEKDESEAQKTDEKKSSEENSETDAKKNNQKSDSE
jgi:preprotein translocase subunit SecG